MIDPTLISEIVAFRAKGKAPLPQHPIEADAMTAQCLALLVGNDSDILPAEIFRELAARNAALMNAPADEIKAVLIRQIVILEATVARYLNKASVAKTTDAAAALMKISLSANRSLVLCMGALYQMDKNGHAARAIEDDEPCL